MRKFAAHSLQTSRSQRCNWSNPAPVIKVGTPTGGRRVTIIWISLDGNDLVGGHLAWHLKLRNIERDPQVVVFTLRRPLPLVPASPQAARPTPRTPWRDYGPCGRHAYAEP